MEEKNDVVSFWAPKFLTDLLWDFKAIQSEPENISKCRYHWLPLRSHKQLTGWTVGSGRNLPFLSCKWSVDRWMFVISVTQWSVIYRRRPLINGRGCLLWPRPFIVVSSGVRGSSVRYTSTCHSRWGVALSRCMHRLNFVHKVNGS